MLEPTLASLPQMRGCRPAPQVQLPWPGVAVPRFREQRLKFLKNVVDGFSRSGRLPGCACRRRDAAAPTSFAVEARRGRTDLEVGRMRPR
jgi:hypothetical protein